METSIATKLSIVPFKFRWTEWYVLWQHHWVGDPWEWKDHFNLIKWSKSYNDIHAFDEYVSPFEGICVPLANVKPTTCFEREPHHGTYWVHSAVFRFSARIRFCSAALRILTLPPDKGQGQSCDHSLTVVSSLKATTLLCKIFCHKSWWSSKGMVIKDSKSLFKLRVWMLQLLQSQLHSVSDT